MDRNIDNEMDLPIEDMSYEQAHQLLEIVVQDLESGEHTLDNAIHLFERGRDLIHHCTKLLNQAELKIQQISGENLVIFKKEEETPS